MFNNKIDKIKKTVAIILIAIGLAMIAYSGFNYVTKKRWLTWAPLK